MKNIFLFLILFISISTLYADNTEEGNLAGKFNLSGYVKDKTNGEELIGATIVIKELNRGAVTNSYGYYSFSLNPGTYTVVYSFIGFNTIEKKVSLTSNINLTIELSEESTLLTEVVVSREKPNANITRAEMSATRLDIKSIQRMPALMGEVDVIKAIQLLPGVKSVAEGSSGFSVRGGATDHNLILLDEATVYNASHLMGFFSVFNNDAVKDVKLYKGDIPASSGGRLASLLDVRMKEGNNKKFSLTGGIGTISSRLTIEGPILSENTSFLVSGRRTYADIFLPLASNPDIRNNRLYFYDLNLKLNHRINEKNRLFISGYFGRDIFKSEFARFGFGNQTLSFRWNHLFGQKLFLNTTAIYSNYNYFLGTPEGEASSFIWKSNMEDYSLKFDFNYFANSNNTIRFGLQTTYHFLKPGNAKGTGTESILSEIIMPNAYSLEHGIYAQNEQSVGEKLTLKYGLRLSAHQNIGKAKVYSYNNNYSVSDSSFYNKGDLYKTYINFEPRIGAVYAFNQSQSVKASYSRTVQYIQQASNSNAGTPLDVWFTASPNVKPQYADQFALGFFQNLFNNSLEASVEGYFKDMWNVVDFKDFANMLLNEKLEGELRTGTAEAYGIEVMARYTGKKINGWVSYTYSKVYRNIETINNGKSYPAPYDKPHDVSVVFNYEHSPKWTLSANWVFSNGVPATFPSGRYEIMGNILPLYTSRNSFRYPNYHRLDFAVSYRPRALKAKKWQSEWNLSIYNVYNRKNAWAINFVQDEENPNITYAEKTYLFSIIPSITYNFKF
jgi:hypothetical protein